MPLLPLGDPGRSENDTAGTRFSSETKMTPQLSISTLKKWYWRWWLCTVDHFDSAAFDRSKMRHWELLGLLPCDLNKFDNRSRLSAVDLCSFYSYFAQITTLYRCTVSRQRHRTLCTMCRNFAHVWSRNLHGKQFGC